MAYPYSLITGVSGVLAAQIGGGAPNVVYTTGAQTITGLKTFNSGLFFGSVGIGTTAPVATFHVNDNTGALDPAKQMLATIESATANHAALRFLKTATVEYGVGIDQSNNLRIVNTNGSTVQISGSTLGLTLTSAGNVGINTASPSQTFHVASGARFDGPVYLASTFAWVSGDASNNITTQSIAGDVTLSATSAGKHVFLATNQGVVISSAQYFRGSNNGRTFEINDNVGGDNNYISVANANGTAPSLQPSASSASSFVGLILNTKSTGVMSLQTNSITAVTVDGSQRVGIGLTNPTSTLAVSGTSLFTNVMVLGSGLVMPSGATSTGAGISWNDLNLFRSTGNVLALNGTAPTLAFQDAGTQRAFIQTVNQSLNVAAQNGLTFQTNANVTAQSLSISGDALFARNVSAASGLFFADTGNYTASGAASVAQLLAQSGYNTATYTVATNIVYTTGSQTITGLKTFNSGVFFGNVGIGTSSPLFPLHIQTNVGNALTPTLQFTRLNGGAGGAIKFGGTNVSGILAVDNNANVVLGSLNNVALAFYTNATSDGSSLTNERMRIDNAGNVGIGTSAPIAQLHVVGNSFLSSVVSCGSGLFFSDTGNYTRSGAASVAQLFALSGAVTTNVAMTNNTTATATFNSGVSDETIYDDSVSLVSSLTINLPSVSRSGQLLRYLSKAGGTIVTVNGNVSVGAAITTLAANSSVAWQSTNTTGIFIRLQ